MDRQAFELRAFDGVPLNTRSHGEGFLAFLESRVTGGGCRSSTIEGPCPHRSHARGGSLQGAGPPRARRCCWPRTPPSTRPPRATVYELDGSGFAARDWADLDLVRDWEAFFADPARLHHHLLDD